MFPCRQSLCFNRQRGGSRFWSHKTLSLEYGRYSSSLALALLTILQLKHFHSFIYSFIMNNEAFQKLVRDRAHIKSTKQIAREAVEDEFRRKGKKRRRGGGDDSSDDDDDKQRRKPSHHHKPLFNPFAKSSTLDKEEKKGDSSNSNYRDRAKERREGKADAGDENHHKSSEKSADSDQSSGESDNDDSNSSSSPQKLKIAPSSVKGLDRSLMTQRDKKKSNEEEDDHDPKRRLLKLVKTKSQAQRFLSNFLHLQNQSEAEQSNAYAYPNANANVSSDMIQYLKFALNDSYGRTENNNEFSTTTSIQCGPAGRTLQRTAWTFSADGHCPIHNSNKKKRVWQPPRETMQGTPRQDFSTRATPLDDTLVARIEEAFRPKQPKESSQSQSPASEDMINSNDAPAAPASVIPKNAKSNPERTSSDDDDDDIFGDEGDYVPPSLSTATASKASKASSSIDNDNDNDNKPHTSVFDNLLAKDIDKTADDETDQDNNVDNFVSKLLLSNHKRRQGRQDGDSSSKQHHHGVGMAAAVNNGPGAPAYGEDMDVDFDGRNEDEDSDGGDGKDGDDNQRKKNKKKEEDEVTMAAKEYGSSNSSAFR